MFSFSRKHATGGLVLLQLLQFVYGVYNDKSIFIQSNDPFWCLLQLFRFPFMITKSPSLSVHARVLYLFLNILTRVGISIKVLKSFIGQLLKTNLLLQSGIEI